MVIDRIIEFVEGLTFWRLIAYFWPFFLIDMLRYLVLDLVVRGQPVIIETDWCIIGDSLFKRNMLPAFVHAYAVAKDLQDTHACHHAQYWRQVQEVV